MPATAAATVTAPRCVQTPLLDRYLPSFEATNSFHTVVHAEPESARAALARIAPLGRLAAGFEALGVGDRIAATLEADAGTTLAGGLVWRLDAAGVTAGESDFETFATPGHAKVAWSVGVSADGAGRAVISVTVRAAVTDDDSRARFWNAWLAALSPLVESHTRRLSAAVKESAEENDDSIAWRPAKPHLQLVK
jgi:hypothetical protein